MSASPTSEDPIEARPEPALAALVRIAADLDRRSIRYCHWKSNVRLDDALRGRTDLDLLVDREQSANFRALLSEHDVKPLIPAATGIFPGIEHHLGLDRETGRLFHLHVHYQLVLGEEFIKSYRLPLEDRFLRGTQVMSKMRVPDPALELIVFVIRTTLKYRDRDVIKDLLRIRSPGISEDVRGELRFLLARTSMGHVRAMLDEVAAVLPPALILDLLAALTSERRRGLTFYRLRRRVRRALEPYRSSGQIPVSVRYLVRAWRRGKLGVPGPPISSKMRMATGGLSVSLIGADGSGKSTVAHELADWLQWKLRVERCYLGSKQPSGIVRLVHLGYRACRRLQRGLSARLGRGHAATRATASLRDLFHDLEQTTVAAERYRRYRRASKRAQGGAIVLFDRFPLIALGAPAEPLLMDGPRIPADGQVGPLRRGLGRLERRFYRRIRPPDMVLALAVSPAVSTRRKPDHDPEVLRRKSDSIVELLSSPGIAALTTTRLDADDPLTKVVAAAKVALWERL